MRGHAPSFHSFVTGDSHLLLNARQSRQNTPASSWAHSERTKETATYSAVRPSQMSSQTNKSSALVCSIFDGHGGYQIAQYLENWIKTYFQEVYDPYESETSAVEGGFRR